MEKQDKEFWEALAESTPPEIRSAILAINPAQLEVLTAWLREALRDDLEVLEGIDLYKAQGGVAALRELLNLVQIFHDSVTASLTAE